ncbi:hypothetical protein M408DRAFT_182228 [Serendipita vermifera MAFF 305830]|uniref:F-box domain-containing protein n=1 Tax=Serendipita vermifera MAFF 305830 TaxID=933852 RepID=A0A0C3APY3_SERVB|nr:hypothetical protein M408DRAFT_182228 [Serendipita vermifera MAFF 305830]
MRQDDVPYDVLEQIFYIHVYNNFQSRLTLLQTCHKWYKVAINYASLWRAISWRNHNNPSPFRIFCDDVDTLARVVNRTGTGTFDLRLGNWPTTSPLKEDMERFTSLVPQDWLSRCHLLAFCPYYRWSEPELASLRDLLGTHSYDALGYLEFMSMMSSQMWGRMMETLMSRIESTSTGLRSLKISTGGGKEYFFEGVLKRPVILGRLRNLHIRNSEASVPWADLPELEELWFYDGDTSLNGLTSKKLRKLTLGGGVTSVHLPERICQQLTHLTFDYLEFEAPIGMEPLKLPSLVSLSLQGSSFFLIDAPKLEELVFQISLDEVPYSYHGFQETTLKPRVIRLDLMIEECEYEPFTLELDIWSRVEELHLTNSHRKEDIPSTLTDALSGTASQQSFRSLKSLTVLHPAEIYESITEETKLQQIDHLRGIAQNRRDAGCRGLDKLEVGWYSENGSSYNPSRADWAITWKNCLE